MVLRKNRPKGQVRAMLLVTFALHPHDRRDQLIARPFAPVNLR